MKFYIVLRALVRPGLFNLISIALLISLVCTHQATAQMYTIQDLGTLGGGPISSPTAINSSGEVTGFSWLIPPPFGTERAFLFDGTTLIDLGTLGGFNSTAYAINDAGQVTGNAQLAINASHAFVSDGTTMRDLGSLGGDSTGVAINPCGLVAGNSWVVPPPFGFQHAFRSDGTTMTDLGTLGGFNSTAYAINSAGQVTGTANTSTATNATHAFLSDGTTMRDLGSLGADSTGVALNESGQVAGSSWVVPPPLGFQHAFLSDGTTLTDLGTLGGFNSTAFAINSAGQVTGNAQLAINASHAFVSDGTTMTDLGSLGGDSTGLSINSSGQVTGFISLGPPPFGTQHGFLYVPGSPGMVDLNSLIPPGSGWELLRGVAINDAGQITGIGIINNQTHAFLMSPQN